MLFNGQGFKSLDNFWKKWIGDFGNNQTKNAAAPRNQCARRAVGVVSQLVDRLPDAFCQLGVYGRYLVNCARDRCS